MVDFEYLFDIAVLGSEQVGKKTLAKSKFLGSFSDLDYMSTTGIDFASKTIEIGNTAAKLLIRIYNHKQLWSKNNSKITLEILVRHTHGAIILYDLTNLKSLEQTPQWIQIVRNYAGDIPIILVGNKSDLVQQREITNEHIEKVIQKHGVASSMEISAKTGENIERMLINLTSKILTESKELLRTSRHHYISLIGKAIKVEERKFLDKKSLRLHRKIWRKISAKKGESFDDYLSRQKKTLKTLIEMRKTMLSATSVLEIMTIWEEAKNWVKFTLKL
jgi:GTPase SAR1 family protein